MLAWTLLRHSFPCNSWSWVVSHSVLPRRSSYSSVEYEFDVASAKIAFSVLARKSKSWKRLGPIIDLAVSNSSSNPTLNSVCDVGTDHGLLATGLAMTSRFNRVVGVDVSEQAMNNVAFKLYDEILAFRRGNSCDTSAWNPLNLDFRTSDGLRSVHPGEADIVCIAGMGVHTMVDILTAGQVNTSLPQLLLDRLRVQRLLLQPANSRPSKLMFLYNRLREIGWTAQSERLEYISSRWYLTTLFERSTDEVLRLPGTQVAPMSDNETSNEFARWVSHHRTWILNDALKTGTLRQDDAQWLEVFKQHAQDE